MNARTLRAAACAAIVASSFASRAVAGEAPAATPAAGAAETAAPRKWKDTAELAYVLTAGNSESSTFGFRNSLLREDPKWTWQLNLGALRTESTTFFRTAFDDGTGDVNVVETESDDTTAENYFVNTRYDRKIDYRSFWYSGLGWERNRFQAAFARRSRRSPSRASGRTTSTARRDSYDLINLAAGFTQQGRNWKLSEYVRADNLTNRRYAGSVIVNEANGRYYEPSPTRNYMGGVEAKINF